VRSSGLWSSVRVSLIRLGGFSWRRLSLNSKCLPTTQGNHDAPEEPFPALQAAWQQLVLETLVVILGWRYSRYDPERTWSAAQAAAVHDASCQRVLALLAHRRTLDPHASPLHARLIADLKERFRGAPREARTFFFLDLGGCIDLILASRRTNVEARTSTDAPDAGRHSRPLFYGGSRGNPGPGGSGAWVVRITGPDGTATLVWSAAMSVAHRSTTNNQAEYDGLLAGLQAAARHRWPNLEVVGDSALILRQLRDYRPPKNARLLRLYSQARRLADQLDVRHWTHHVRAHNKMADSLANLAMDTRASSQVLHPTARSGHATLTAHLSNDLSPWLADTVDRRAGLSVLS
jgi:ribonuclease HI